MIWFDWVRHLLADHVTFAQSRLPGYLFPSCCLFNHSLAYMVVCLVFISNCIKRMSSFQYQHSEAAKPTIDEDIESAGTEAHSQHVSELIIHLPRPNLYI